jgi:hypothetical protein
MDIIILIACIAATLYYLYLVAGFRDVYIARRRREK